VFSHILNHIRTPKHVRTYEYHLERQQTASSSQASRALPDPTPHPGLIPFFSHDRGIPQPTLEFDASLVAGGSGLSRLDRAAMEVAGSMDFYKDFNLVDPTGVDGYSVNAGEPSGHPEVAKDVVRE
jgi:hypothetical protein